MILFWIIATLMLAVALWLLIPALLGHKSIRDLDRNQQNVAIARDRLKELESEYGRGGLSETDYEQAKRELEQALLIDVDESATTTSAAVKTSTTRASLVWVALGLPLAAILLYLQLGAPDALKSQAQVAAVPAGHAGGDTTATMEQLVAGLAAKLQQEPANPEGWFMLGRSYMSMGRYAEAAEAFQRVLDQVGDDPSVMLRYADALAMTQGGQIGGKPFELIKKALELKPDDTTGLWLAGLGYEEQGEYETAVRHWRKLEGMLQEDPASLNEVRNLIARAEQKLGRPVTVETVAPQPVVASPVALKVTVALDAALQEKVSPEDTVFIFARAMEGPPMPLAAVRKQVRDLPVTVTLDDSMAMMPQMKLSNYAKVLIAARISKSGNIQTQSGDLTGEINNVATTSNENIKLTISQRIP
jgi:cytochrome c-type biogenesis protein CcmH